MPSAKSNAAPSISPRCQFGVTVFEDGTMAELKVGTFSSQQAEEIARRLVTLAAAIRNASRRSTAGLGGF